MSFIDDETKLEEEEWTKLMEKDYHHPFVPYHVQKQFMSTVYKCLEEGKVGVLESPTGTVSHFLPVLFSRAVDCCSVCQEWLVETLQL